MKLIVFALLSLRLLNLDMTYNRERQKLPASELGDERCVEIGYFGHGDIFVGLWHGDINRNVSALEDGVLCFNLAHGNDVLILASIAGYLRRAGRSQDDVKGFLHEVGEEVMADFVYDKFRSGLRKWRIAAIADGEFSPRHQIYNPKRLDCLLEPVPTQPDVISQVGGTGIYVSTLDRSGSPGLAVASVLENPDRSTSQRFIIRHFAEFCVADTPALASMVCSMALGEYRLDIQHFIANLYKEKA